MSKKSVRRKTTRKKTRPPRRRGPQVTSEEALKFIRNMQKAFPKAPRTKKEKERLRSYIAKFRTGLLKAVSERVQSDLMVRRPETIRPKDFKTRPTHKKPRR